MPRRARLFQKAICYHVMNRGVNRNAIFFEDKDRAYFVGLIARYKEACEAKVYHWVLMDNHYHLLIEIAFGNLRAFVGGLQQSFAYYHHKNHHTSGVFWQGRFISKPVEIGDHLISCGRYIERNPVRAGLVEIAWDYPWSSAQHYVDQKPDVITDQNPYLGAFATIDRAQYAEALMSAAGDEMIQKQSAAPVIGSPAFRDALKTQSGRYRFRKGRPSKRV